MIHIAGYQIGERLGAGRLGQVFKGEQLSTGREVAVRVLYSAQGLEREFRRLAACRHPALAPPVEAGEFHEPPFLAAPYFRYNLANSALAPRPELWLRQLCHGLISLHGRGLFHLNLKPHNVVVDVSGNVQMIDFGLTFLRTDGPFCGSYWYMAPDQAIGGKPDPSWDVYALGATIYAAIKGRPPRFNESFQQSIDEQFQFERRMNLYATGLATCPLQPLGHADKRLNSLIERCLALDPRRRLRTPEQVLKVLEGRESSRGTTAVLIGLVLAGTAVGALSLRPHPTPVPEESVRPLPVSPTAEGGGPPHGSPLNTGTHTRAPGPEATPSAAPSATPRTAPPAAASPSSTPSATPRPKGKAPLAAQWRDLGVDYTFPEDYVSDENEPGRLSAYNRQARGHRIELRCEKASYADYSVQGWTPSSSQELPHGRLFQLRQGDREAARVVVYQHFKLVTLQVEKTLPDPLDLLAFLRQAAAPLRIDGQPLPSF